MTNNYIFIFIDNDTYETGFTSSFKDALLEVAEYYGDKSELFEKSLCGFDDGDIANMVDLFEHFSYKEIKTIIKNPTKIYDMYEDEKP